MPGTLTSSKAPSINRAHRLCKSGASSTGGGHVPPAMTAWTSLIVLGHVLKFSKPFAVMQTTCVEINQCVGCTAVLARSSGEGPVSPRHRAGVASMNAPYNFYFHTADDVLEPHAPKAPETPHYVGIQVFRQRRVLERVIQ